jgi:hypothetical protein
MICAPKLQKLNSYEIDAIRFALKSISGAGPYSLAARIMLEDDAEFVRGLFWTRKEEPPKEAA